MPVDSESGRFQMAATATCRLCGLEIGSTDDTTTVGDTIVHAGCAEPDRIDVGTRDRVRAAFLRDQGPHQPPGLQ